MAAQKRQNPIKHHKTRTFIMLTHHSKKSPSLLSSYLLTSFTLFIRGLLPIWHGLFIQSHVSALKKLNPYQQSNCITDGHRHALPCFSRGPVDRPVQGIWQGGEPRGYNCQSAAATTKASGWRTNSQNLLPTDRKDRKTRFYEAKQSSGAPPPRGSRITARAVRRAVQESRAT